MSAPPPELQAFHLGFVVHDVDAAMDRYRRMLGVDLWRVHEVQRFRPPWNEQYTDTRLKVAFGRAVGLTFEFIQVLEGRNQHSEFLETHGEGVQHIGLWSPNVRAAVESAVAQGARIVNALLDPNDQAVVQLSPGSSNDEIFRALSPERLAYVDPGLATVQLEFIGSAAGLRDWLQDDFERIIAPPPWDHSPGTPS